MYPRNEWFSTYEPFKEGIVLMGNDITCKTVGIGNIHIKIFDKWVRTLKDMRHVPDLRKKSSLVGSLKSSEI